MSDAARMVRQFHEAFGAPVADRAATQDVQTIQRRGALIQEEYYEVVDALYLTHGDPIQPQAEKLTDLAKELADLVYVVYGTAIEYGIPLDAVLAEVHRSNMTKLGDDGKPVRRNDGKVLKGPNYKEANVLPIIERAMNPEEGNHSMKASEVKCDLPHWTHIPACSRCADAGYCLGDAIKIATSTPAA